VKIPLHWNIILRMVQKISTLVTDKHSRICWRIVGKLALELIVCPSCFKTVHYIEGIRNIKLTRLLHRGNSSSLHPQSAFLVVMYANALGKSLTRILTLHSSRVNPRSQCYCCKTNGEQNSYLKFKKMNKPMFIEKHYRSMGQKSIYLL